MDNNTKKELLETSKKNYNKIATDFNETRKKNLWPPLLEIIDKNIESGDKILDVGCGSGRLFRILQDKNIKYLGVDNSKSMIDVSKKEFSDFAGCFIEGDLLNLGLINDVDFDYVMCIAVLHHIPSFELRLQALQQMKNKVRYSKDKKGKIILTVWNMWSRKKFLKLIFKFYILKLLNKNNLERGDILFNWKNPQKNILSKRYYHAFTKRELKKIINKASLEIDYYFKDKFNYYFILSLT